MAYQVFRVAKVKRQGVGGCQQEHNRTEKDRGRFPDSHIDYDKTSENVYLVKSDNYWEDIKATLQEFGITKWRKDAVVMNDAVFTFSPEVMETMSEENRMQYFKECAQWYQEHFGIIINCTIHKDESTWHMHVDSVPLVQDKDGKWRLSAKDQYGSKSKMASLQTDLYEKVSKKYGLERGESRVAEEQRKHKTTLEHDIEEATKKLTGISSKLEEMQRSLENYGKTLTGKKQEAYQRIVQELAQTKAELTQGLNAELQEKRQELQNVSEAVQKAQEELKGIEATVKTYASRKEPIDYKKAPLNKGMYLVPEEAILDYANIHVYATEASKKNREADQKAHDADLEMKEARAMKHKYETADRKLTEVEAKEKNLESYIQQKANEKVARISKALGKTPQQLMKLVQQYEEEQEQSQERIHSRGMSR